jgi:6-phosphogluconolactonase (cycloisomerase 2 family)
MPANNAPVTQSATVSTAVDTPYVFQLADFAFDDSADAPTPNTFANVIIRTLPSPGVLMFDADGAGGNVAVEVAIGQVISAADIAAGHLTFTPGEFASGNNYASFNFQVQDNGAGPALYQTGPVPRSVLAIDVNHDSKLDLVYVSDDTSAGQIGVRLGAGDGTFGVESRIAVGDTPSTLIAADLDGDNNRDLVVANYIDNTVQVLKGNADGTFESPVTIATLNTEAIVAGDFNHDGFTDLAITERNDNLVDILLGDGTGTGFTTLSYDNGANGSVTTSVAMADLNEDGEMDLVFAQENDQFNTPNTGSITFVLGNADGSFQGPQNIATGLGHAYAVKIADLNNDGHADVIYTTVETPGSIIVQLGVGNGTFLAPTTISQPAPSEGLAVADIDGDSKLDLVVTDYQPEGSVSVLRGNGDGTFQSAIHIPVASYPFSVATGDLNGDGKVDIITTNYIDNNLSVLLNGNTLLDGNDNTSDTAVINIDIAGSNHEPTADAGGPYTVQAGDSLNLSGSGSDVDNDALTYSWDLNDDTVFGDAVGATPTLTASQLQALGITSGSYTISLRVSDGQGGETTDLSTLYLNNAPTANPDNVNTTEDTPITINGATLFGNDADPDGGTTFSITAVSDAQGGSVTLNGGNPNFTPDANFNGPASFTYEVSDGHGGTATATATVNVAAVNDAPVTQSVTVSTSEDTAYVFQLADFDFADPSDQPNPDSFANVVIRTLPGSGALMFDADGAGVNAAVEIKIGQVISTADITAGHLSYLPGADGNGDGYASFDFQVQDSGAGPALYQTGQFPRSVLAIDVNHDSKLDLVYVSDSSAQGKIGVRLGAGDGTFGSESAIAVGNGPSALIAVNLDGDNNPDLVVTNYITGNVQVLKGNANGTFQGPVTIDNVQSVAVVAGNFNHDSFADLAIADREHSEVRILLGDGTGTGFTTAVYDNGSNGSVTTSVATADFNEDGNMDLVFASENDQFNNLNTGNVTLVLGNADGTFQAPQNVAINLGHTYAVKTADFNDDGHADLAYTLIDTPGAVVIRLGVGDGTFESPETIALDAPAIDVAVADIDGDGELDLIATDYQPAGSLSVLRGNGDGTFQPAVHVPVASNPFSIGTGDLNGDGKIDIIATNYIANNLSVLLNGNTLLNGNANTSEAATITIDVTAVNDAPVNTIAAQTATEDTESPITGLSVADADIGSGHITVTLTVQHGTIHVADDVFGGLDSADITDNDTASVTLSCDPSLVNATLASGITYSPDANFKGTDTLTMLSDDGANDGTAADGAKTDSDTVDIAVASVNDAPVIITTPDPEDPAAYVENAAAVHVTTQPVTVTDVDNTAFGGGSLTAALTAGSHAGDGLALIVSTTPGTGIEVAGSAVKYNGTTIGTQSGIGTASLAVALNASADVTAVQALAGAVGFSSTSDDPTADTRTVTFTLVDGSGTANDGHDTGSFTQTVLVTAVNDAPVNTVPGAIRTSGDVDHAIAGLSVSDPDATSLTTTLHVDHGTLTVAAIGGAAVGGSGTDTVTLTGSVAQIDAALSAANNVLYHGTLLGGIDQLTMTSTDGGGTGTGGTLSDTDTVAINPRHTESDFNGDAFSDILFRNNSTGDTGYTDLHNNVFNSLGGSPAAWSVVGAGDYNGDNFSDILFRNNSTGDTGYTDLHNNVFNSLGGSPASWSVVGSGDYNGDNFSDILFRNNSTGDTGYTDIHNNVFHSLGGSPVA